MPCDRPRDLFQNWCWCRIMYATLGARDPWPVPRLHDGVYLSRWCWSWPVTGCTVRAFGIRMIHVTSVNVGHVIVLYVWLSEDNHTSAPWRSLPVEADLIATGHRTSINFPISVNGHVEGLQEWGSHYYYTTTTQWAYFPLHLVDSEGCRSRAEVNMIMIVSVVHWTVLNALSSSCW